MRVYILIGGTGRWSAMSNSPKELTMSKRAILIPIYEPDASSLPFLRHFKKEDFDAFLVIDDGSGEAYASIFKAIAEETPFEVVSYSENKGKGYALKHGFRILLEKHPDLATIVTADGDGQHTYADILHVRDVSSEHEDAIIMGNRLFDEKTVPIASKIGHLFANISFRGVSKQKIRDVQTGLRAIPSSLFPLALQTPGNRYDYEHDFLLDAAKTTRIIPIDIEAIYIDNNRASHFRPVRDTLIIYKRILGYVIGFLITWGIDLSLFYLLSTFVFTANLEQQVLVSALLSRYVSGLLAFPVLVFFVFDRRVRLARKLIRTGIFLTISWITSGLLTYAFVFTGGPLTLIKCIVDASIFVVGGIVGYFSMVVARNKRKSIQCPDE